MPLSNVNHRMPATTCPWCDRPVDAATELDAEEERRPEVDDFSVCIRCGSVNVYTIDFYTNLLTLRRATESEWQSAPEPIPSNIRDARRAVHQINSKP